jgi:hypothetical protein
MGENSKIEWTTHTFNPWIGCTKVAAGCTHCYEGMQYPGGKNNASVWKWIIGHMPPHAFYVEPFFGSGGVFRRKPPAMENVLIEIDEDVVRWMRYQAFGAEVVHGCGIQWLEENRERFDAEWLIYCDPPYLLETRVKKKIYKHEMTDQEHLRLLEVLDTLDARVMLSGYPSPMYEEKLVGWHRHELETITRGGTMRTEVLYCNFSAEDLSPFMARSAGTNFRMRERIKRKRERWRKNFVRLAADERGAILSALVAAEQELGARG